MTDHATRLRRLHYRAWHRGTREADYVIGGYFDRYNASWSEDDMRWFEALIDEQDVDILAWAMGTAEAPPRWQGPMLTALQRLDFVEIAP
jgi:antitoxin CptB